MSRNRLDPELQAMSDIQNALFSLPENVRNRVIAWVKSKEGQGAWRDNPNAPHAELTATSGGRAPQAEGDRELFDKDGKAIDKKNLDNLKELPKGEVSEVGAKTPDVLADIVNVETPTTEPKPSNEG